MDIRIAEQDAIDQFEPQVQRLLAALGHPEALVTDLSQVSDFLPWTCAEFDAQDLAEAREEESRQLSALGDVMGRTVEACEYLWQMGRELALADSEAKARARPN